MEVLLTDFVTDQDLGLNGLVNLSNFAFLLAFSVRDVLMLRILGLASDVVILPYDYFQNLSPFAAQIIAHSARGALARKLGISVRTISL
jgi:hypothetical protein